MAPTATATATLAPGTSQAASNHGVTGTRRSASAHIAWSTRDAYLDEVGFIHAGFEHQVAAVGSFLYRNASEPLVVLAIDTDLLDAAVVVENLEGGSEAFPHIYGT